MECFGQFESLASGDAVPIFRQTRDIIDQPKIVRDSTTNSGTIHVMTCDHQSHVSPSSKQTILPHIMNPHDSV